MAATESAVVRRGAWQLGPIDLEVRWADRLAILGPERQWQDDAPRGPARPSPARLGRAEDRPVGRCRRARPGDGSACSTPGVLLPRGLPVGAPLSNAEGRSLLAKFGLGAGHILRPATSLSPGERTRAELALLMARGTNCLVLDEPTNHLDLPAIEQLEHALDTWEGTLMLVTHDRRLLETIAVGRRLELADSSPSTLR